MQEAKLLQNVDVIRSNLHNSLDSQRKDLLSLQKQLSNCKGAALRISRSNNIDELSAHIDWVDSRVNDLISSVGMLILIQCVKVTVQCGVLTVVCLLLTLNLFVTGVVHHTHHSAV